MLQIERIKLNLDESESLLRHKAASVLRISPNDIQTLTILRRSVDARDGVQFVYTLRVTVKNEKEVLRRCRSKAVSRVDEKPYRLPRPVSAPALPPLDDRERAEVERLVADLPDSLRANAARAMELSRRREKLG